MARRIIGILTCLILSLAFGCNEKEKKERPPIPTPSPSVVREKAKFIDDEDVDGFDALIDAELTSGTGIIVVKTKTKGSNWSNRLTAWIKAWSDGGPVRNKLPRPGQTPRPGHTPQPADSIPNSVVVEVKINDPTGAAKEGRLLVENTVTKFEQGARDVVKWYQDETIRKKRVDLLHPYRFASATDGDGYRQIIFYKVSE